MPFEQLHIFLIINLCIQAPDMELKAMDCERPDGFDSLFNTHYSRLETHFRKNQWEVTLCSTLHLQYLTKSFLCSLSKVIIAV
jgi:hypothetical protein